MCNEYSIKEFKQSGSGMKKSGFDCRFVQKCTVAYSELLRTPKLLVLQ